MSIARGQLLHLRLFIEGVEVPVIGAMASASENSPAAAQIEVIPTDTALRLLPRSKVHLFFLDYDNFVGSEEEYSSTSDSSSNSKGIRSDDYKLLFSGELFTIMYTKTGFGSRSLVLQCLDDSNIWDTSFLYLLRYTDDGGENAIVHNTQTFISPGSNTNPLDDILNHPELVVSQIAARGDFAFNPGLHTTRGMVGGLFAVLELLGGLPGKFVGVTAWHTIQEARIRLMDQLAGDKGDTAKAFYDLAVFENWLTNKIGDAGTVISFRDLIEMINQYIYYAVTPNPVARYKPGARNVPDWPEGLSRTLDKLDPEFEATINGEVLPRLWSLGWEKAGIKDGFRSLESRNSIRARQGKEPLEERDDKAHDWGFAVDIGSNESVAGLSLGFLHGQASYGDMESIPAKNANLHKKCLTILEVHGGGQATLFSYLSSDEVELLEMLQRFYRDLGDVAAEVGGLSWGGGSSGYGTDLLWSALGFSGGDPVHLQQANWRTKLGTLIDSGAVSTNELQEFYKSLPERERLITQIFRPDCWFVAPPVCNVIFPEEVNSFTYTRQMMRETTRLQLTTFNAMYEDLILNSVYFAPSFDQVESLSAGGLGSAAKAVVYPHEKFAGIIPKMERISEASFYARLSEEHQIPANREIPEDEKELADAAGNQIDMWAARTAAFNFLSYRYAARSAVLSGKFLPRLVCGFPGVAVDRPVTNVASGVVNAQLPTHFLGMVRTLSHSLTQAGGSTSVTMSHARSHQQVTDTDELPNDLFSVQITGVDSNDGTIEVGEEMKQSEFSFAVRVQTHLEKNSSLEGFTGPGPNEGTITTIKAYDSLGQDIIVAGETELIQIGTAEAPARQQVSFSKLEFSEETGTEAEWPIEDAIRPPWFSEEYSNAKIGGLYDDFFGCQSVVDLYTGADDVESAVNKIVSHYSSASGGGSSAAAWINELTSRRYAALPEVLGDATFLGFHSYAVGPYDGLEHLDALKPAEGTDFMATQLNPDEENRVDPALDPRKERHRKVLAYRNELLQFRGMRG